MMEPPGGVVVILKDGRRFCGPIWTWRPEEGWFSLVGDESMPECFQLTEVESAVDRKQRVAIDRQADVDLLERARQEGWNG
jgi:hypothetical protein